MKKKRLQYDRANLERAYTACKGGMSMYKAAIIYSVPEATLRDRTREKIPLDAHVGYSTIFTANEEKALVDHIKYMGVRIQSLARDYAVSLWKSTRGKDSGSLLCNCWFYGFLGGWQDLKVSKPQSLAMNRAESASRENLNKYYKELHTILTKSNLHDKPENIYNIDETGFSTEHSPFKNHLWQEHLTTSSYIQQIYIDHCHCSWQRSRELCSTILCVQEKTLEPRFHEKCDTRSGWRDVRNWMVQQSGVPELLDKILHQAHQVFWAANPCSVWWA